MEAQPTSVAISALISENKILLIKRGKDPFKGLWGLPGGKIKFGEHIDEAAVREIKEEIGIESIFESIKGVVSEKINEDKKTTDHGLIFVCKLSPIHHISLENEDSLKWFDLDKIKIFKDKIIPSDLLFIENFVLTGKEVPLTKSVIDKIGENYIQSMFGE